MYVVRGRVMFLVLRGGVWTMNHLASWGGGAPWATWPTHLPPQPLHKTRWPYPAPQEKLTLSSRQSDPIIPDIVTVPSPDTVILPQEQDDPIIPRGGRGHYAS